MKKTVEMTTGNIWKNMLVMSLPLMASNVLQVFFNMSDIAVVGRFAGEKALGAVGSTPIVVFLFVGVLMGLGGGINSIVARYIGAKMQKDARQSVHTSFLIAIIFGIFLLVFGEVFTTPLLKLLGTKSELIKGATLYLRIYYIGLPALAIYNFGGGVFSAIGDTKKPLIFLSISGIINVSLNVFFVVVLKIDVAGVGLATIISQYFVAILILVTLFRRSDAISLRLNQMRISRDKLRFILQIGIPGSLQNIIFAISNLYIVSAVNSFSTIVVEGSAAAANFDSLTYDALTGIYVAATSFVAQNFGAKNKERILKSFKVCISYSLIVGATLGGLAIIFGRPFLSFFTTNGKVIDAGLKRLLVMASTILISSFMDGTTAALRGLGKTLVPTVMSIIGTCIFRIIWIYTIFAKHHTIFILFIMYGVSWVITGMAELIYFKIIYSKIEKSFN